MKKPKPSSNKRRMVPDVFHSLAKAEVAEDVDFIQKAIQSSRPAKRQKTEHKAPRVSSYNASLAQQCDIAVNEHKTQSMAACRLRDKLQKTRDEVAAYRREIRMLAREETKLRSVYNTVKTDMEDKRSRVGELRQTLEQQLELVRQNLVHEQTLTRDSGNKLLALQKMDQELRKKDLRVRSLESEVEQLKLKLKLYQRDPNAPPLHLPPLPHITSGSTPNADTPASPDGAAANPSSPDGDAKSSETPPEHDDTLSIFVAQLTKRERELHEQLEKMNFYRNEHEQSKNRASAIKHQLQEARAQVQKLQMDHSLAKSKLLRMEKEQDKLRESNVEYERKLNDTQSCLQHETETNGLVHRQKHIADERALFAEKSLKEVLLQVETYASGLNTLQNQYNSMKQAYDEMRRERDEHLRRLKSVTSNDKKVGPSKEPTPEIVSQAELEHMQTQFDDALRDKERAELAEKDALEKLSSVKKAKRSQDNELKLLQKREESMTKKRNSMRDTHELLQQRNRRDLEEMKGSLATIQARTRQLEQLNENLSAKRDSLLKRVTAMEKIIVVQAEANNCLLEEIHNMNQQIKEAERLFRDKKREIEEFRQREDERFKKELSLAMGLTSVQGTYRRATQGFTPNGGTPRSTMNLAEENPSPHPSPPSHAGQPEDSPSKHANGMETNNHRKVGSPASVLVDREQCHPDENLTNSKGKATWGRQYSYQSDYGESRNGL